MLGPLPFGKLATLVFFLLGISQVGCWRLDLGSDDPPRPAVHLFDENIGSSYRDFCKNGDLYTEADHESDISIRLALGVQALLPCEDVAVKLVQAESLNLTPARRRAVTSLELLRNLPGLRDLTLDGNDLGSPSAMSMEPLKTLSGLQYLSLVSTELTTLEIFHEFPGINRLSVANNTIVDVSPLENLHSLRVLNIANNRVDNLSPLANLANIMSFTARGNPAADPPIVDGPPTTCPVAAVSPAVAAVCKARLRRPNETNSPNGPAAGRDLTYSSHPDRRTL